MGIKKKKISYDADETTYIDISICTRQEVSVAQHNPLSVPLGRYLIKKRTRKGPGQRRKPKGNKPFVH